MKLAAEARPRLSLGLAILLALPFFANGGPNRFPLPQMLSEASDVVVGTVERVTPVRWRWSVGEWSPRKTVQEAPYYPCEAHLKIDLTLKGNLSGGSVSPVLFYGTRPDCALRLDPAFGRSTQTAIWLLRTERDRYRLVVDGSPAMIWLRGIPPEVRNMTLDSSSPAQRVVSLMLRPGAIIADVENFAEDSDGLLGEAWMTLRWRRLLEVLGDLYAEAGPALRRELCLVLSKYQICMECARVSVTQRSASWKGSNLADTFLREFAADALRQMDLISYDEERGRHITSTSENNKAELIRYAMTSVPSVRMRARALLKQFFRVNPADLPKVGCAAQ